MYYFPSAYLCASPGVSYLWPLFSSSCGWKKNVGHRSASILWQVFACVLFLLYSRASMLDFSFDLSEERPLEAFEDIYASYESKK